MVDLVAEGKNVKTVLFLCTGNYYRSRFAEELFNHEADRAGLDWIAHSCGLALERGANNVGPIAPVVLHALKELTISARGADRFPRQCTVDDLANADFVVAVKEAEHRPLVRERFGEWERRLDYWNVHDVEDAAPVEALKLLAREIRMLVRRFTRAQN
jgi:protein-tyrosine phosphatase